MASPLSSSTIGSHRILFLRPSPLNRRSLFVKPKLPFNRTNYGDFRMRLLSTSSKIGNTKELIHSYDSSIDSKLNPFEAGTKNLEKLVATILIFVQVWSPMPLLGGLDSAYISPAEAVLYSPDTKVPRTGELALRKAIPANPSMKTIQASLEDISYLLRIPQRKPYGTMESNVKKALKVAIDDKDKILASIPADLKDKGSELYATMIDGNGGLQSLITSIKKQDPDKVSLGLAASLDTVAELELLQASGLSFLLPQQYLNYPKLAGRGTVEMTIEKGDGSTFSAEAGGDQRKSATIQIVIDGYSAPLTAGNFAKLVTSGAYDGVKLNTVNQAVITEDGSGKVESVSVPLEVMPSGQFEPLYRTPLSVQDGELPVLPLSVYGAVAMAHSENSEDYSSPYQFFFYLYDKRNSGLGGLSFDEGQFSVFGYTTAGRDILGQIKTGDVIKSAKLIEGQERLILPAQNNNSST
ncbi:PREDICTED: peptidyl-prolyl cis-trans isomerase CYP37, chloroplastic-like isoform X2 [Camelina sativa]|uniref:Peptidyl-prolyl cis-trans isomerase CYP37, chloroplastic-like isoform X2 n=1 Tax=Camelina sativa TaxID=90675 RepID=A0ABM0YM40_CAMSA|nr:PREDICTED: peptidyl-prolyl cis-trans isomerase CYP37, chloroplastic-like isoform X2 [Camelina sativa]